MQVNTKPTFACRHLRIPLGGAINTRTAARDRPIPADRVSFVARDDAHFVEAVTPGTTQGAVRRREERRLAEEIWRLMASDEMRIDANSKQFYSKD